jgi:predicted aspartyl protease
MLLDTGADHTTLTPQAAKRLGLDRTNWSDANFGGIGGQRKVVYYQSDNIRFGMMHGWDWLFAVADVGLESLSPTPDGLLGADIFGNYDIDLNLPGRSLRVFYPQHDCSKPSAFLTGTLRMVDLESTIKPGVPISMDTLAQIRLHVTIDGHSLVAQIDTGAPNNILFLSGLEKLKWNDAMLAMDPVDVVTGIGPEPVKALNHIVPELQIGSLRLEKIPVKILSAALGPAGPDMIIGLELLRRVHVWISHSSAKVILQYPPMPSPPLPVDPAT